MGEIDECTLDRHYQQQLLLLDEICANRCNKTDLAICKTWKRIFEKADLSQKYARNCLMLLLYSQIDEVGRLGRPFTDMRNGTQDLNKILDEYDGDPMCDRNKGGECGPDELLPTTSQHNKTLSDCTKETYDSHVNFRRLRLGNFSGSPQEWCALQGFGQEKQEAVKMEKPFKSTRCDSAECARMVLPKARDSIYACKVVNFPKLDPILDLGSLGSVNLERQIGGTEAGSAPKKAHARHLEKKAARDCRLKSLAVNKIVSCDDCCRKRNCACIEFDPIDEPCDDTRVESVVVDRKESAETIKCTTCALCADAGNCDKCRLLRENEELKEHLAALRMRGQAEAETYQRLQHLEVKPVESCEERLNRLRSQIFNSSNDALLRLAEWKGTPEHMNFFLTVFDQLTNDEEFKMQLTARDRKFEELLQATFNRALNYRAEQIKNEAERFVRERYEKKRAKAEMRLQKQLAVELHHQQLNMLNNMTLLKKLFLEECAGRIEQSDYILKCLDEEFDRISKEV